MAKNQESINRSLFELLRSRGYAPTLLDTSGKEIPVPEEAEVFQFKFTKDGEEYGTVTASIDGLHKLVIYFGDDVANSAKGEGTDDDWFDFIKKVKKFKKSKLKESSGDDSWYKLLNHLKRFAQQHQLSFEVKNRDHLKYDMAKREHMKKQERIAEGYHPMGKNRSYNDNVPTVKIVIEHTRQIEEGEQRYRNVNRIFLENTHGERILAPTTKPGVAQIYARHLAEGGMPHDDRWNHIIGLCEEYNKMGAFVRATRNNQFNESAQQLVNEGINHYQSLRESLSKMRGSRGYNSYFESYTPPLMEDETEENNLNELFVQETLDPRIESVMPILSKLHKKVAEMKEVNELSEWADNLTEIALEEGEIGKDVGTVAGSVLGSRLGSVGRVVGGMVGGAVGDNLGDMAGDALGIDDQEVDEGLGDIAKKFGTAVKTGVKKAYNVVTGGEPEDLIRDLQKKAGVEQTGKKPESKDKPVGEALDAAHAADQKINTPAVFRKNKDSFSIHKSNNDDDGALKVQGSNWRVTPQDLAKADEKNMTSPAGMAALQKRMSTLEEEEVDESALQASFGIKKYGKKGMDALRKAGREHASKKKMQNIRAKFSDKEKPVTEDGEFAGDYATGEAGQWRNKGPKANKPATIGDLVGEGEENNSLNPWKNVNTRVDKPKIKGTNKYAKSAWIPEPKPPVERLATPLTNETVIEGSDDLARILNIAGLRK